MRIPDRVLPAGLPAMRAALPAGPGGFQVPDGIGTRAALPLPAMARLVPVAALRAGGSGAAVRGGRRLLDGLDRLRLAVLGGGSLAEAAAALRNEMDLADGADDEPQPDGTLHDLLEAIRLRADVELAKLVRRG